MKTTLGERLAQFIDYKKLSKADFARQIGSTAQKLNYWISQNIIPLEYQQKMLIEFPDCNMNWLLSGDEKYQMLIEQPEGHTAEPATPYQTPQELLNAAITMLERIKKEQAGDKKGG